MAREPEGFREQLELIIKAYPNHECLSAAEVRAYTGLSMKVLDKRIDGWVGNTKSKTITRVRLAKELCR